MHGSLACARALTHAVPRASSDVVSERRVRANTRRAVVRGAASQMTPGSVRDDDALPDPGDRTRSSRRDFLAAQVIAAATATQSLVPPHAWAAVENAADLPKGYYDAARAVVKTLTESLEFEATDPTPADRFRKAEPAKEAVKAFIKDWAASPKVQGERAHDDIVLAVRELGEFYKANGSRAALTPAARESILAKLADAKDALPAAPPSLADRLLGL